ncbi:MAG: carboxymuconolactone decarboxylase family protein [Holophagales bacterium]|nr:carboxymuconolactone decarboxylase family protein [Holophagales bacterium]
MPWIEIIRPENAEGLLRRLYDAAVQRAGKVFQVVQLQSPRPKTLRASTQLYKEIMFSPESPLSRRRREMIATVVSRANHCHY